MDRAVYERIKKTKGLPSPTGVALQILRLAQDDTSTVEAVARAVEKDPAVASRLLALVNSPLAGLSRQVASVSRAVALVGIRAVTQLALGFSLVSNNRKGACAAFDYGLFWSESLATAVAARHLAHHLKCFPPDEAFTCGLLSQVGRLALATAFPESYSDALKVATTDDPNDLCEIERAVFGIDHCAIGGAMMADWHMPGLFCDAVRIQLNPESGAVAPESRAALFARVLQLAGAIAGILPRSTAQQETLSNLVIGAHRLGIELSIYHEVFDSISQEWHEAGAIFSVSTRSVPPFADIYSEATRSRAALQAESGIAHIDVSAGNGAYARG